MNIEVIKQVFDNIIDNKGTMVTKCSVSSRGTVRRAFGEIGKQYGLNIITDLDDDSGIAFELHDDKHGTVLQFTKAFVNKDYIDYKNQDNKKINLEEVFRAYDNLPDKVKDRVGTINYMSRKESADKDGILGWSKFIDTNEHTGQRINTVNLPDYLLLETKLENSYERVLAHEAMHNYDYPRLQQKTIDSINRVFNGTQQYKDLGVYVNNINKTGKQKYTKTMSKDFVKAVSDDGGRAASDYGKSKTYENFAETGSMVVTGYRNPDNPNSTVLLDGKTVQFREWVTSHPHQAQYMIRELYGDKLSLDEVLRLGNAS